MNDDRHLWDLLGASPRPAAPPFFSAKVMRSVGRSARPAGARFAGVLRWLAPAAVAALFVAAVLSPGDDRSSLAAAGSAEFTTMDLVGIVSPQDYEVLDTAGYPFNNGFLTAGL